MIKTDNTTLIAGIILDKILKDLLIFSTINFIEIGLMREKNLIAKCNFALIEFC